MTPIFIVPGFGRHVTRPRGGFRVSGLSPSFDRRLRRGTTAGDYQVSGAAWQLLAELDLAWKTSRPVEPWPYGERPLVTPPAVERGCIEIAPGRTGDVPRTTGRAMRSGGKATSRAAPSRS